MLAHLSPEALARAVVFVPSRRSAVVMRRAFQQELSGRAMLLPNILPLAEIERAFMNLLGDTAFAALETIPPAMPESQQRYLLADEIIQFERKRTGDVTLDYALTLADTLMVLQEQCARSGVVMTQEKLRALFHSDFEEHWKQALLFLGVLTDRWPEIEAELGMTIAARREVLLLEALTRHWQASPPDFAVVAVGSTGSQPATAALLQTIAGLPKGEVIIGGIDGIDDWASIEAGHPLFHIKKLLRQSGVAPEEVTHLATAPRSLWLDALAATSQIPGWREQPKPKSGHVRLIPCAHAEEEVRVISLLLREALESPAMRVAVVTPDEGLMARVASHMKRYGISVDRLNAGTLATTQTGSLWMALVAAIIEPEQMLRLRSLLHHPLLNIAPALLQGLEKGWHGVNRAYAGQLPRHDATLRSHPDYAPLALFVKALSQLSAAEMKASAWIDACAALLQPFVQMRGEGAEAVEEQLVALLDADRFGTLDGRDFQALLAERLGVAWRDVGINTHPQIALLTPVEARLEQFDRVILANMQDTLWPGTVSPNPWLNLTAQKALGLPAPEEHISLMAHDVLMLGSSGEVFLTYPERDAGSPTTRSRFIERLVTLLASHGVDEAEIGAEHYIDWANALQASDVYLPERELYARPSAQQRPRTLPVTDIDKLFTDPFSVYARHVLGLRKLDEIDAAPEASDFGSIAHRAIEVLAKHWDATAQPAQESELQAMAQDALRDFSERPSVDLFWRARLLNGLRYVNRLEAERRAQSITVATERKIEGELAGITLHGRIDRLEQRASGTTIIDHKTGEIPSTGKILEGRALQLLAYAMLLSKSGAHAEAIEYWALPKLGDQGELRHVDTTPATLEELEGKLSAALTAMLDEQTPFLARPVSNGADERFGNDYDGISRYDEWAG